MKRADIIKILVENRNKEFVSRIIGTGDRPAPLQNADGSISTHLMAAEKDDKGDWMVFPTIVHSGGGLNKMALKDAMRHAKKTGEYIPFGKDGDSAVEFSARYKEAVPNR